MARTSEKSLGIARKAAAKPVIAEPVATAPCGGQ
jgi:hypothetical protein